nr:UDP-glycosyltransferase superfamily protein [Tanacetum cinerariifolium]
MHGDKTPDAYLNLAQEYADALAAIGEPVKDKDLVMLAVSGLPEEYNGLKTTITIRQNPTAFSELHALLSDHDYMLGKTRVPAPSITSSFAANYAVGSPSMPEACQAQLLKLIAQLSVLGFQVSPIAPSSPQAFYGVRPSNNSKNNNNNNRGNRNNSRGNNNRGRGNGRQFDWASTKNTVYDTCNGCVSHLSPTSQTSSESSNGQPSPLSTTSIPTPPPPPLITRQRPANLCQNPKQRVPYNPFANHATVLPTTITEPTSFTVANNFSEWRQAMKEKYDALMKNRMWSLVPCASNTNVVDGKWVYRLKQDKNGAITRYKARFVAKGFRQQLGIDFHDTFIPVVKSTTIRVVLSLAVTNDWPLRQLDIQSAFLHGNLKEHVYMKQPSGFIDPQRPNHVCLLYKSLYGLKQALHTWFERLSKALFDLGFKGFKTDPSLFIYSPGDTLLYIMLYVNDIIVICNNKGTIDNIICQLGSAFALKDLGPLNYFFGIEIVSHASDILLSQKKYILELLQSAGLSNCNPVSFPVVTLSSLSLDDSTAFSNPVKCRQVVGSLQHVTLSRPDIAFAVNKVCQYMHAPAENHWSVVKRILRYLHGTVEHEAEYKALADIVAKLTWLQALLNELEIRSSSTPILWCDNLDRSTLSDHIFNVCRMQYCDLCLCSIIENALVVVKGDMDEYNRRPVLKSVLSGKNTPKGSPSFRRLNSSRTPRRGDRSSGFGTSCFRSNRIVLWLLLITLWAYAGFYIQSRWAHGDNKDGIFGGSDETEEKSEEKSEEGYRRDLSTSDDVVIDRVVTNVSMSDVKKTRMVTGKNGTSVVSRSVVAVKKTSRRSRRSSRSRRGNQKKVLETTSNEVDIQEEELPQTNATYGMLVGPFGSIEDSVLEWSPSKRSGTCDRSSQFARLVWSRKFVLIFHELSMTGAPLSMMELASELLSCGATVSVVALSRKGGLLKELARKRIKVLEDKDKISFKTAMKADLVIAGSAVCASWIEQYIDHSGLGETFGRVTIEAMAFGIPVLGTDAGGTKEIVEHNVTGLLHPIGHPGTTELSKNLQYLLKNPSERHRMGLEGREKVKKMYLKKHMYKMFWQDLNLQHFHRLPAFIFPNSNHSEHGQNIPPAPPPSSKWSSPDQECTPHPTHPGF